MTDTSKQWIRDAAVEIVAHLNAGSRRFQFGLAYENSVGQIIAAHAPKGEKVDTSKERAAFEKWFLDEGLPDEDAEYCQQFWRGWMARAEQSTETPPLRWNQIPGLTPQQNAWMDDLAHGLVTQEALDWVVGIIEYLYAGSDERKAEK